MLWGWSSKKEDEVKLRYLTFAMTASKTSSKSTYAIWLRFFNEKEGSQSEYVVHAFLSY